MVGLNFYNGKKETGRIESIKHIEWMLIFFFLFHIITSQKFWIGELLIYMIGSQFPDILEGISFSFIGSHEKRRSFTHVLLIPILLLALTYYYYSSLLFFFSLGYLGHLTLDLFAGGDPVYIFGFGTRYHFQIINKDRRLRFGEYVYRTVGYLWEDQTNPDLAWFWVLQFFGSVFAALSFCFYLIIVSP